MSTPHHLAEFLDRPGQPGAMGAIMDEYARAAHDLCATAEAVDSARFTRSVASPDPDTMTMQAMLAHVVGAAYAYADYIRKARALALVERAKIAPSDLTRPADLRPRLAAALRYTEGALDGLYTATEAEVGKLTFAVRWGPTYDPEMILEHAIVHLLRHRRQITRWPA